MPRDPKELGDKLTSYADAIVAFAFVQSVAFAFALGSNDTFLGHAVRVWWLIPSALIFANLLYAYLVRICHRGEDALFDPAASSVLAWEKKVRTWRFVVIVLGLIVSLVAYGASFHGYCHDSGTVKHATQ
jgi:hypothetical protein